MLFLAIFAIAVVVAFLALCSREAIAVVIGVLVAAAVPAGALAIVSQNGRYDLNSFVGWFVIAYFYALLFVTVLGIPAFFALRPFRPGHWWSVGAAGVLLGFGVEVIDRLPNAPATSGLVVSGPLGGLSALVFWVIWRVGAGKEALQPRART